MRVEVSAVDRQDLEVTGWKNNEGWIEIWIRSAVGIPTPVQLSHTEALLLVVVPEKREPMTDTEKRAKILRAKSRYCE